MSDDSDSDLNRSIGLVVKLSPFRLSTQRIAAHVRWFALCSWPGNGFLESGGSPPVNTSGHVVIVTASEVCGEKSTWVML